VSTVLTLNPGSSSLKASVRTPAPVLSLLVERIGTGSASISDPAGDAGTPVPGGLAEAVAAVAERVHAAGHRVEVVAHRVVHGGPRHQRPSLIGDELLADLRAAIPLAPLHLPASLAVIEQAGRIWPTAVQIACFDTGFHAELPARSARLPVPAELVEAGVRRYGFHGLSVSSVLHQHPELGQVVIAHLGSGCSVTAVADGRSRHTTMSLTPTGGMVSGTRPGDLDPEVVLYLIEQHDYQPDRLRALFDHDSGLAGIAGGRHDLRDLLAAQDPAARLALEIFTGSAAMAIASCATTLDAWQALVFTGGVGEHAEQLRDDICDRLLVLRGAGSVDDAAGPAAGPAGASTRALAATGLRILVVAADEEAELDRLARQLLTR
jgi:acetate kinase